MDGLLLPTFNIFPRFIQHFDVCTSSKKIGATRLKGVTEKLEHFSLLVEQAAVCTLRIRLDMLPIENDKQRMHHAMSPDRQTVKQRIQC